MKLVTVVWVFVFLQLVLAGVNLGIASTGGGNAWNWAIGILAALVGAICMGTNAWSTWNQGRAAGIRWATTLFRR